MDQLNAILRGGELSAGAMAFALALAFGMGAVHALSPGHGKTLVAAYLVGARGTLKHAAILGGAVTFTHTISVFALGFATLFLSQYIMPERLAFVLSVISGISIIAVGLWLLSKRFHHLQSHGHSHFQHHHHHDGDHHHVPEEISVGGLIALGASGGLAPCPSALVLMLTAISLGHVALGLLLLVSFSVGLAVVLVAIGAAVLYAKHLLPRNLPQSGWLPVASAVVIIVAGVVITAGAFMTHG